MDKAEVRLRFPINTLLLSHSELLDHISLSLGAHVFRLCSSTDIAEHPSEQSGLSQIWVELQNFLQQNTSTNPFIYCEEEQELRCEESDDHPRHLKEKATDGGVTYGGYVKVQSIPHAYDQGGQAEGDDAKGAPLLWFSHPQIWGVAGSSGIGCSVPHLSMGQKRQ
jgi:hypothetical protein